MVTREMLAAQDGLVTSQIAEALGGASESASVEIVNLPPNALQRLMALLPIPWWSVAFGVPMTLAGIGVLAVGVDPTIDLDEFADWRGGLLSPAILMLTLFAEPAIRMLRDSGVVALRKTTGLSTPEYQDWIDKSAPNCTWRSQMIAFGLGALATLLLLGAWSTIADGEWANIYGLFSLTFLDATLAWLIYTAYVNTKLFAAISTRLSRPDPMRPAMFYPVGRWNLSFSTFLVLAVGVSVVFLPTSSLVSYETGVVFSVLILAAIAVFFLGSSSAHRAMAGAKQEQIDLARDHAMTAMQRLQVDDANESVAASVTAWIAYERRIAEAPSWPFDTAMLRRLAISIAVPGAAVLARVLPNYIGG